MPLASVQLYVQKQLDGLEMPAGIPELTAYVTPPTVEDLDGPRAYVWAGRMRAKRQTMPRVNINTQGSGYKHLDWTIDVYLTFETTPDTDTIDTDFPQIIDAVMTKLWTTAMPVFIDDLGNVIPGPYGPTAPAGARSQILQVGEDFEFEYPPERVPATLRMLYFVARFGFTVYEAVQA